MLQLPPGAPFLIGLPGRLTSRTSPFEGDRGGANPSPAASPERFRWPITLHPSQELDSGRAFPNICAMLTHIAIRLGGPAALPAKFRWPITLHPSQELDSGRAFPN